MTHLTENGGERSQIGNDTGREKNVTDEIVVLMRQVFRRLHPTGFLSSQATDQRLGSRELRFAIHHLAATTLRDLNVEPSYVTCLDSSSFFLRFSSSCRWSTASFSWTVLRCARFSARILSALAT